MVEGEGEEEMLLLFVFNVMSNEHCKSVRQNKIKMIIKVNATEEVKEEEREEGGWRANEVESTKVSIKMKHSERGYLLDRKCQNQKC